MFEEETPAKRFLWRTMQVRRDTNDVQTLLNGDVVQDSRRNGPGSERRTLIAWEGKALVETDATST